MLEVVTHSCPVSDAMDSIRIRLLAEELILSREKLERFLARRHRLTNTPFMNRVAHNIEALLRKNLRAARLRFRLEMYIVDEENLGAILESLIN